MTAGLGVDGATVRRGGRAILDRVDAMARPGRVTGVIGANGAGKSTLLRILAGVGAADEGRACWRGAPLSALGAKARARAVGFLPQRPAVDWPLTVREAAALGRLPHLPWWQGGAEAQGHEAVARALEACALDTLAARRVDTLSGGEFARAMLARLLAGEHAALVADEPVADLDPPHRVDVMRILRGEAVRGACVVVALHDLVLADAWCDEVWLMKAGALVAAGPPDAVLDPDTLARAYGARCSVRRADGALAITFGGTRERG